MSTSRSRNEVRCEYCLLTFLCRCVNERLHRFIMRRGPSGCYRRSPCVKTLVEPMKSSDSRGDGVQSPLPKKNQLAARVIGEVLRLRIRPKAKASIYGSANRKTQLIVIRKRKASTRESGASRSFHTTKREAKTDSASFPSYAHGSLACLSFESIWQEKSQLCRIAVQPPVPSEKSQFGRWTLRVHSFIPTASLTEVPSFREAIRRCLTHVTVFDKQKPSLARSKFRTEARWSDPNLL